VDDNGEIVPVTVPSVSTTTDGGLASTVMDNLEIVPFTVSIVSTATEGGDDLACTATINNKKQRNISTESCAVSLQLQYTKVNKVGSYRYTCKD
jgi:hypothetical protein